MNVVVVMSLNYKQKADFNVASHMYSSERRMSQNALLQCIKQCRNVFKWMIFSALCVFLCLFSVFPVSLASCWRVCLRLSFLSLLLKVIGFRLRLHIDGYSECYDFWVNADSPVIKPVGWCESTGHKLHPPKGAFGWLSSWACCSVFCKIINII